MREINKWLACGIVGAMLVSGSALADDNGKSGGISGGAEPAGLYSAAQLLDAEVYAEDSSTRLGQIHDIMFNNRTEIRAFVVQTRGEFGLAGKSYVVRTEEMTVATLDGESANRPEYRVTLNMDAEGLARKPIYGESWWNETQVRARKAWQDTKDAAGSAWTSVKEGTHNLIEKAEEATEPSDQGADNGGEAASGDTGN